jgi:hypothetical protein
MGGKPVPLRMDEAGAHSPCELVRQRTRVGVLPLKSVVAAFVEKVRNIFRRTGPQSVHVQMEADENVSPEDHRCDPRQQTVISVPIYDRNEPGNQGVVLDISERGLQIIGLKAEVGERKTMILDGGCILGEAGSTARQYVCSFQAECRWVQLDGDGGSIAGFRIKVISLRSLEVVKELVRSLPLVNP